MLFVIRPISDVDLYIPKSNTIKFLWFENALTSDGTNFSDNPDEPKFNLFKYLYLPNVVTN